MSNKNSVNDTMGNIEKTLEGWFKQVPSIPENGKEALVKYLPWIVGIFAVLGIIGLLTALSVLIGFSFMAMPYVVAGGAAGSMGMAVVSAVFAIAILIVELIAVPGLNKRKMSAWKLMFYVTLINALQNLISLNLVSLILGTAISLYLLFQIKSYYKE